MPYTRSVFKDNLECCISKVRYMDGTRRVSTTFKSALKLIGKVFLSISYIISAADLNP